MSRSMSHVAALVLLLLPVCEAASLRNSPNVALASPAAANHTLSFMKVELGPFASAAEACDYCFGSFTKEGVPPAGPVASECVCMAKPVVGAGPLWAYGGYRIQHVLRHSSICCSLHQGERGLQVQGPRYGAHGCHDVRKDLMWLMRLMPVLMSMQLMLMHMLNTSQPSHKYSGLVLSTNPSIVCRPLLGCLKALCFHAIGIFFLAGR
mmetsp:Transcript_9318/g.13781  ORF Transcript_9318/g.13781 Transcript_9318/m.13781 type:complete len:208 (-) Transcript_9318:7-630(-)